MAVRQIDIVPLTEIGLITATTAGATTNGISVHWDNTKATRHDIAVTLQNIADAILIEEQVTF